MNKLKKSVWQYFAGAERQGRKTSDGWPLPEDRSERVLFSFLVATDYFGNLDFYADERLWKVLSVAKKSAPPAEQEAHFPVWIFLTLPIPFIFHLLAYARVQKTNAYRVSHWIDTGEFIALDAIHMVAFTVHMLSVVFLLWLTYGLYILFGLGMLFIERPDPFSVETKAEALSLVRQVESTEPGA